MYYITKNVRQSLEFVTGVHPPISSYYVSKIIYFLLEQFLVWVRGRQHAAPSVSCTPAPPPPIHTISSEHPQADYFFVYRIIDEDKTRNLLQIHKINNAHPPINPLYVCNYIEVLF